MLVLLSFALVLVATVLLVLGLLSDDGLLLIYLSIGSSVLAAVVLLVALRVNRPGQEAARTAPAPLPEPEPEPVLVGAGQPAAAPVADPLAPNTDPTVASGEWLAGDQDAWAADDTAHGDDWDGEVDFPIADYDTLTTGQILPLLPQLYADEIDVVEERERATKGRAEILAKLAQLRAGATVDPLASYTEAPDDDSGAADDWFPIEDYESLSAAQIRPLLRELDRDELELVRSRELSLGRRQTLLDEIDVLLGDGPASTGGPSPDDLPAHRAGEAPAAPARGATAAKRSAPAQRASTKKAAPTRKAAGAKEAAAKTSAAKKAAPAKRSATTKTSAAKKAAPAKRSASAKTSAAKKAAPAKRSASTKTAAAKQGTTKKATATKKAAAKKATATKKAPAKKATTKKAAPAKKATKRSGR